MRVSISRRAALRATTAGVVILHLSQPAFAQETSLGVLILGESKRDVETESAVARTTIDDTEILDRQAGTVAELFDTVPGVTLVNGSTAQGSGINIRGFGANATFGTDQKVLIQIDGATKGSEELYRIGTLSGPLFAGDPEVRILGYGKEQMWKQILT